MGTRSPVVRSKLHVAAKLIAVNRTDRLQAVIEALRSAAPEKLTSTELASRFEVTARTIERDLSSLREAGVPVVAPSGRQGGYSLDLHHTIPPVHLNAAEATAVVVSLARNTGGRFAESNLTARRKVLGAMSAVDAGAARRLSGQVHGIQKAADELVPASVIQDAIGSHEVVNIRYRRDDGTISTREIEPIGLVSRDRAWQVVAWCRLRDDHRTFRLDRIEEATSTGEVSPERQATSEFSFPLSQPGLFP